MDTVLCRPLQSHKSSLSESQLVLLIPRHVLSPHLSRVMRVPQVNGTRERPGHRRAVRASCGERPGRRSRQSVHHGAAVTSRHRRRSLFHLQTHIHI